ncbi:MAG: AAA-like domain-containing protein [Armatimonadetes bacterium]|nr:AAA-like domain-containing protein [Armatimonadota bacterium]
MTNPGVLSKSEVAHVLFLDIVGYSLRSTTEQSRLLERLNEAVNGSKTFQAAKLADRVLPLATGDGMALVFFQEVAHPAECAIEIVANIGKELPVRMGIHSGLIQHQADIAGNANVAGEGINTAQRVMDFGEAGHVLLTRTYADWLAQLDQWHGKIVDFGEGVAKHGQRIKVCGLAAPGVRNDAPVALGGKTSESGTPGRKRVVILYKRNAEPDSTLLNTIHDHLERHGEDVFIDRHLKIGADWAASIEKKIRDADVVIALLSDSSVQSEMLEFELETVADERARRGKPLLLPIFIGQGKELKGNIGSIVNPLNRAEWSGEQDTGQLLTAISSSITEPMAPQEEELHLEPAGGAVPVDSPFYIERATDAEAFAAVRANESIILIKGPRQMGKTSLISRLALFTREQGWRTAMTDFQKISFGVVQTPDLFYKMLAATLAKQLRFKYDFDEEWMDVFGPNLNMDNFMRSLLEESETPLVWFMDEADKSFGLPFASDFFGLVRSWHNSRATEPFGPWGRFTIVIGYATEAHLFIQDMNQSPFNVGRHIELDSFNYEQTMALNQKYGSLLNPEQIHQLLQLISGQPFLTRRAFDVLARHKFTFAELIQQAASDEGPFGDHLKRILISVTQIPEVTQAIRSSASNLELADSDASQRLVAAGVLQKQGRTLAFRSPLYERYLKAHFQAS